MAMRQRLGIGVFILLEWLSSPIDEPHLDIRPGTRSYTPQFAETETTKYLQHVPPHLRQEFKIMRDLDQKVQEIVHDTQKRTSYLLHNAASMNAEVRGDQVHQIMSLFKKGKEMSNDKVSRAESAYELVDKQIRKLDADMFEFKKALAEKELKKVKKARTKGEQETIASPKMPATAALALALTNNPSEVLDMPVDPNEPVYCLCQQVSYGEMVACDNRDCPIEWFHFECVRLASKPRGQWFCPQCTVGNTG